MRSACRKIEAAELTNARVLEIESFVRRSAPAPRGFRCRVPSSCFPIPGRSGVIRRAALSRRIFSPPLHRALVPDGTVRIATDEIDYFREIERLVSQFAGFYRDLRIRKLRSATSTFEKRFRQDGLEIYRLVLRKVSPSRNGVASQ